MSKLKINPTHGGRGPQPSTFARWVLAASKRGAKRWRVHLGDGSTKLVAHKNATDSARRMLAMQPARVEGLDDADAEVGEWTFPEEADAPDVPGYLKEEDDTEEERLLKTFAHLLADAHRISSRQLVEVVSIQSRNFAEERKNLLSLQLASERLFAKRLRLPTRLRVAGEGDEEGDDDERSGGNDTFMQDLLAPLVERMAGKMGGHVAESIAGHANGETKEEKS
jgi:hypothetical protein